jgi:hypothetical protein
VGINGPSASARAKGKVRVGVRRVGAGEAVLEYRPCASQGTGVSRIVDVRRSRDLALDGEVASVIAGARTGLAIDQLVKGLEIRIGVVWGGVFLIADVSAAQARTRIE